MALDYFILVFVAAIGVYQIASIPAGLRGLWLFKHRKVQYLFGAAAVVGAFVWFYASEERNVQHTVEGAQQLTLFLAAALTAYLCTGIIASILHWHVSSVADEGLEGPPSAVGMQHLKRTTLLAAIRTRLRNRRRRNE